MKPTQENLASALAGLTALDITLPTIEENLALDEALLIAADEHGAGPVLRFWEPVDFAVVLGATCRMLDDVDVVPCRADGVVIARRASGGGTVLVGPGTLNVAVVLPTSAAPGLGAVDTAHAFVLERMATALRTLGPPIEVKGLGDLTLGFRKFGGSAQRRLRSHFLVHATLLYRFPLEKVAHYTALPRRQPAYRAGRSHEDFLVNVELPRVEMVRAISDAWRELVSPTAPGCHLEELTRDLVATKYGLKEWVERL